MKSASVFFLRTICFGLNILFSVALVLSYFASYISAEVMVVPSFLALFLPVLVVVNIGFLIVWVFVRSKKALVSFATLIIGLFFYDSFFQFRFSKDTNQQGELSIMSFNVRYFDKSKHFKNPNIFNDIKVLIDEEKPDIICFQEFNYKKRDDFNEYPHKYVNYIFRKRRRTVQAVFSKYPIVSRGSLDFSNSGNNGIYTDVLFQNDTIRVYNLHFQSFRIEPTEKGLSNETSGKLYHRMGKTFVKQEQQVLFVNRHMDEISYPKIICGDFNNTQFSHVYQSIVRNRNDSFLEKGKGFGRTFDFKYFPMRIDFILSDDKFEVKSHKNFNHKLSDHFPIMASFNLKSE